MLKTVDNIRDRVNRAGVFEEVSQYMHAENRRQHTGPGQQGWGVRRGQYIYAENRRQHTGPGQQGRGVRRGQSSDVHVFLDRF